MCQNLPFFGPKQVFSPWRGLPRPPPLFQGCPMQQKRVTGAKECTWTSFGSLSPPKCHIFRQKSAKINFGMSLLHKIIGARALGRTGRPLGRTFLLHCQRRHPELPKIPTYLPHGCGNRERVCRSELGNWSVAPLMPTSCSQSKAVTFCVVAIPLAVGNRSIFKCRQQGVVTTTSLFSCRRIRGLGEGRFSSTGLICC